MYMHVCISTWLLSVAFSLSFISVMAVSAALCIGVYV